MTDAKKSVEMGCGSADEGVLLLDRFWLFGGIDMPKGIGYGKKAKKKLGLKGLKGSVREILYKGHNAMDMGPCGGGGCGACASLKEGTVACRTCLSNALIDGKC